MVMATNANATEYNISCFDCTNDWYEGLWIDYSVEGPDRPVYDGWNIIMKGRGGENVIVCILDRDKAGKLVDGKTYDEAYIVTDWSGVTRYGYREDLSEETGITYVQTHDEDGKLHVKLNMTGQTGDVYHVTYDESCQALVEVQELMFTDDQVELMDNTTSPSIANFQIIGEIPGEVSIMVAVNSDHMVGHYTMDDLIYDFSDVTWGDVNNGEYSVLKFCDLSMDVTADPELPGAYYYDITVITKVGWEYHTVLHSTPWVKPDVEITETKTIHANNLRMMDYREAWGELLFVASSPEYALNLYAYSKEPQGTFSGDAIDYRYNYVWYWENGVEKQATAIDGEYTYAEDAEGNRSLTGWIDCTNGVHYILDLRFNHANATRAEELTIDTAIINDSTNNPEGGGIVIEAVGENQYIVIGIYTPEIAGIYTEQDMDWQVTYIVETDKANGEYLLELLDANVVVEDSGDGENYNIEARMTMQAEMNKNDVVEYVLHMSAWNPTDIKNVTSEPRVKVRKIVRNGRVVLDANGDVFNAAGARLK